MALPYLARYSFLLLAFLGLTSGCKKVCDNEDAPTYSLSPGQQDWRNAYVKDAVWRFQNARGYVRTYRVARADVLSEGGGGGKSSLCASYFTNYFVGELERTDSVAHPLEKFFRFQMSPANAAANKAFDAYAQVGGGYFSLPIDRVEDGRLPLGPATVGNRTYPAVLESTYAPAPPLVPRPTAARRLYVTKAEGIIRFEEFGGTVWNRL